MLKLSSREKELVGIILAIVVVGFLIYIGGTLTGKVVETCTDIEVCENVTVQKCVDNCSSVCEDVTSEKCETNIVPKCSEECEEVDNETVCSEVCVDSEEEVCSDEVEEVCRDVCSDQSCEDEIVQECRIETICEEIDNETISNESPVKEELPDDKVEEKPIVDEEIVKEIKPIEEIKPEEIKPEEIKPEEIVSLTASEKDLIKSKTGESSVSISRAEVANDRLLIKFEIGEYWILKTYDATLEKSVLDLEIENDKIKFLKKIVETNSVLRVTEKEEYLGDYEI